MLLGRSFGRMMAFCGALGSGYEWSTVSVAGGIVHKCIIRSAAGSWRLLYQLYLAARDFEPPVLR